MYPRDLRYLNTKKRREKLFGGESETRSSESVRYPTQRIEIRLLIFHIPVVSHVYRVSSGILDPDPGSGSGAFLTPGSGMDRSQHPDPGPGTNNPDHIF